MIKRIWRKIYRFVLIRRNPVAYAKKIAPNTDKNENIIICLSGRGDKDVSAIARYRGEKIYE